MEPVFGKSTSNAGLGAASPPLGTNAICALLNILPLQNSALTLAAEALAISLVVTGIVTLSLRRSRARHQIEESSVARTQAHFVVALKVAAAAGGLMLGLQCLKYALDSEMTMWTSHVVTILFTVLVTVVATLAVLKREERLCREIALNEERYKLLFEKSLTGAYRITLDGRILDCNVSYCLILGYATREEMIGHSIVSAYFNSDERTLFIDKLRAERNLTNFEQRLQRKDGSTVWVLNNASLVTGRTGPEFEIKGTLIDISEIRRAEQENRRLAAIVS
jgi:PAS domain S-box-containing protein